MKQWIDLRFQPVTDWRMLRLWPWMFALGGLIWLKDPFNKIAQYCEFFPVHESYWLALSTHRILEHEAVVCFYKNIYLFLFFLPQERYVLSIQSPDIWLLLNTLVMRWANEDKINTLMNVEYPPWYFCLFIKKNCLGPATHLICVFEHIWVSKAPNTCHGAPQR